MEFIIHWLAMSCSTLPWVHDSKHQTPKNKQTKKTLILQIQRYFSHQAIAPPKHQSSSQRSPSQERRKARLTISRVQTRRIQTLSLPPSTPSTRSSSVPSHQHRRAGFRQNSKSFCAMPSAAAFDAAVAAADAAADTGDDEPDEDDDVVLVYLLVLSLFVPDVLELPLVLLVVAALLPLVSSSALLLMSVRNRASAKLQMTALFGSPARWPQLSSWLNPLFFKHISWLGVWGSSLELGEHTRPSTSRSDVVPSYRLPHSCASPRRYRLVPTAPVPPLA